MNIKSDIEIAQEHTPKKITEIAAAAGIEPSGQKHHRLPA